MSSIPKELSIKLGDHRVTKLVTAAPAANADRLGDQAAPAAPTEIASGWDAYDVWRRFIKDARNRRRADQP